MANLIQEIEAQIAGAKATAVKRNVGVIREIGDGVARVEGLGDVMSEKSDGSRKCGCRSRRCELHFRPPMSD